MGSSKDAYEQRRDSLRRARRIKRAIKTVFAYILVIAVCILGVWLAVVIYDRYKTEGTEPPTPPTPSVSSDTTPPTTDDTTDDNTTDTPSNTPSNTTSDNTTD